MALSAAEIFSAPATHPPVSPSPTASARYAIAVEAGGRTLRSAIVDLVSGQLFDTPHQASLNTEPGELPHLLGDLMAAQAAELAPGALRGAAIACATPLIGQAVAALRARLPNPALPLALIDPAAAAAVGEARYGAGYGHGRLLGVTLGERLGICLLAGDALRSDRLPDGGRLSASGLLARLGRPDGDDETIRQAAARAVMGDRAALAAFLGFGAELGARLRPYVERFAPQAVLLLGGIAGIATLIAPIAQPALPVPTLAGHLGSWAALLGAAAALDFPLRSGTPLGLP